MYYNTFIWTTSNADISSLANFQGRSKLCKYSVWTAHAVKEQVRFVLFKLIPTHKKCDYRICKKFNNTKFFKTIEVTFH
jgi:hypothetical protein